MKGATMATAHLKECVRVLVSAAHEIDRTNVADGLAAMFELIDQPWDFSGDKETLIFREGYETCMKDMVDAVADEWGVALPEDPVRRQENNHGGAGQ